MENLNWKSVLVGTIPIHHYPLTRLQSSTQFWADLLPQSSIIWKLKNVSENSVSTIFSLLNFLEMQRKSFMKILCNTWKTCLGSFFWPYVCTRIYSFEWLRNKSRNQSVVFTSEHLAINKIGPDTTLTHNVNESWVKMLCINQLLYSLEI